MQIKYDRYVPYNLQVTENQEFTSACSKMEMC